ncbi:inositol-pentakisphosphate 2-kinase [Trichophaea hybrida]|nr:inositol-pentakisphosphate 2-kinase [Trichophaea hybrida]
MDTTASLDPGTPPPSGFLLSAPGEWEYFTEGASNILFRYIGDHPYFKRFLLRLRKLLPGAPTTIQLHDHLNKRFAPLLGNYIMRCDLIELDPGFVAVLNKGLQAGVEGDWAGRPVEKVRRLLDENEQWGMLVEDMSCGNYLYKEEGEDDEKREDPGEEWRDMATVEFKPKWLSQSPNAPANWILCRTCAVRMMNGKRRRLYREEEEMDEGTQPLEYCPLDLSSGDQERIEQAVYAIVNSQNAVMIADPTPGSDDEGDEMDVEMADAPTTGCGGSSSSEQISHELAKTLETSLVTLITHFFRKSTIIPLLSELQHRFGTRGVFTTATLALMSESDQLPSEEEMANAALQIGHGDPGGNDIWTAMTLRDCSLFLKVWVRKQHGRGMEARIECKVGDLDLKTGDGGRAVYWRDVERRLRKGGWYVNKDMGRNCRTGQGMA